MLRMFHHPFKIFITYPDIFLPDKLFDMENDNSRIYILLASHGTSLAIEFNFPNDAIKVIGIAQKITRKKMMT